MISTKRRSRSLFSAAVCMGRKFSAAIGTVHFDGLSNGLMPAPVILLSQSLFEQPVVLPGYSLRRVYRYFKLTVGKYSPRSSLFHQPGWPNFVK